MRFPKVWIHRPHEALRRDLYRHLAGLFTNFQAEILAFADASWYQQFFGTSQEVDGHDLPEEDEDDCKVEVSAYVSKGPLQRFCTKLAKGHFELSLCKITRLGLHCGLTIASDCESESVIFVEH